MKQRGSLRYVYSGAQPCRHIIVRAYGERELAEPCEGHVHVAYIRGGKPSHEGLPSYPNGRHEG
jgi:hypothetical protein